MIPPGALEGVRVADFGRVLAAPYATMLMADLGAEVIKVERPDGGDETRAWGPPWSDEGESTYFLAVNRNKESRVLDLRSAAGRAAASDLVAQAVGGLMSVTGSAESGPMKSGVALVDVITGLHATIDVLAALRHRDRTGEGQRVEVNLLSSILSALTNQASTHVVTGAVPQAMGNTHPSIAPYEVLATADRPLAVAAANDKLFGLLAEALGRPELAADPRFASNADRVAHPITLPRTPAAHRTPPPPFVPPEDP